jgi:3-phytase
MVLSACGSADRGPAADDRRFLVTATAETDPVPSIDDAADDPAIWVHPTDPSRSLILATDKQAGLFVYGLDGKQRQFLAQGRLNNVDIARDRGFDVAVATNRTTNAIDVFRISPDGVVTLAGSFPANMVDPYGVTLYRSPVSGQLHVFACDKPGLVRQWRLELAATGAPRATLLRSFEVGSQSEGMIADEPRSFVFVGEEGVGIWRYPAEPSDPDPKKSRVLVDSVGPNGSLVADVEGLTIYRRGTTEYLVASSQGDNSFRVYDLAPPHTLRGSFAVSAGTLGAVEDTDGLCVTGVNLGGQYSEGLVVVQDGKNGSRAQNFKLVPWSAIAKGLANTPATTAGDARK